MPGLVPGIHVFPKLSNQDVDGRDKPGHDGERRYALIFCTSASETSKLAKTFCTSSLSSSDSISLRIFSPASSSSAIVFCGFQSIDDLRGSPNLASSALVTSFKFSGVVTT